jgi:peptidoglycan hydrolase-like protein with peptidoglycan-binding domain
MANVEGEVAADWGPASVFHDEDAAASPRDRALRWSGAVVVVVAVAAAGFVAGRAVLPPAPELVTETRPALYEVGEGTVGRVVSLSVVASIDPVPVATSGATGMVTDLRLDAPRSVEVGEVLLRLDERPMVVSAGAVPFFRELGPGAVGRDVEQLQRFLLDVGEDGVEVDGRWGAATSTAVRAWRQSIGLSQEAVIEQGLLVAVGELPAVLTLDDALAVGGVVNIGQVLVQRVDAVPRFHLPLRLEQAELVPLDSDVQIRAGDRVWEATSARAVQGAEDIEVELEAPGGGPPCGDECGAALSSSGETIFPADVVVVPERSGPVVPVAGVITSADGTSMVALEGGQLREVEVLAVADGLAVVDGVDVGERIELRSRP